MVKIALILPKNGVIINFEEGTRLYFLAGPIRGGGDWQAKAIKMLTDLDPHCYIACPCRYDSTHELHRWSLPATMHPTESDDIREIPEPVLEFPNQTMWERYYLEKASQIGSIIFWLPCEDKENPRKEGPYAQDTYGELSGWRVRSAHMITPVPDGLTPVFNRVNLVIGAEKDFPGLSVIQKNFDAEHQRRFPFHTTLEETIAAAVKLGKETNPQRHLNSQNA